MKTKTVIYTPKTNPLPHQLEATQFLVKNNEAAVFDEQGVGKTKEVIDAIITILKEETADAALVICPKSLLYNWEDEIKKHSYLVPITIDGSGMGKKYRFLSFANIYILNYEGVKAEEEIVNLLLKSQKFIVVLDEAQRIKNPESQTFKSIDKIKNLAVRRFILTGTPVANKPEDLWAQFYFLDNGKTLGNNYSLFKREYNQDNLSKSKLLELQTTIRSKSIRRLKDDVLELPDKVFKTVYVDLASKQKQIYLKLKKELLIEVLKTDEQTIIDESKNILKKLLRLVQIASNPSLIVLDYKETPSKFKKLDELVKEIVKNKEKVIIWTSFVENVKLLKNRYKGFGSLAISGETEIRVRHTFVNLFQNDENYKVMIANPAAAREGITLTAANNAIYVDRTFNLVDYLQSQDRIHRISQRKESTIIKLIANDTIDLFVEDNLSKKQDVARVIQGDTNEIDESNYLTKSELVQLLK
jgi:SNF2 family DNA or RNA helicase